MKTYIMRLTLTFVAIIAGTLWVAADNIAKADSAYTKGDYGKAIDLYREVAEKEGVSSQLWYNMGNAYSKGGFYGKALVCFERALRLDPANFGAKENIKYIEAKVLENNKAEIKGKKISIEPESRTFFHTVGLFISRDHLSDTWAVWGVVMFLIFMGCLSFYIFSKNVMARKFGFFGGIVALALTVVTLIFAFMAASYRSEEGVVTQGKVKLLSEASQSSKESAIALTRGTKMSIMDSIPAGEGKAEWYKVRLNSDFVGWISADDFEPIEY